MRKEVFLAITAGILIGLIFAFGAWKVAQSVKNIKPVENIVKKPNLPKNQASLNITNLYDYDVLAEDEVYLEGLSSPLSNIVISTDKEDYYLKSDKEGVFKEKISLPLGMSEVKVKNVDKEINEKLLLVYSPSIEPKQTSYIGTITDISSSAIQIKTTQGDIKQISTDDNTKYINSLKKNIEIKSTDLAIGDYVICIGKINGGGAIANGKVLKTTKIIVGSPLVETEIEVKKITIDKITKTTINDIALPKKWIGPNLKELEIGQEIIVAGKREDDDYTLRTIFSPVE